jgi:hypothetical protein
VTDAEVGSVKLWKAGVDVLMVVCLVENGKPILVREVAAEGWPPEAQGPKPGA